jgi:hypothetical protein
LRPKRRGCAHRSFCNDLALIRLAGGTEEMRGLLEFSNAKSQDVTASQRAFKHAVGIDFRLYNDLWIGVTEGDRAMLLGHTGKGMPRHYASADAGRMVQLANRVLERGTTRTVLRVIDGGAGKKEVRDLSWARSRADFQLL